MTNPEFDNSMLLSAILSGGVIGGSVGLLDNSFDRAKWAVPLGMMLGIFLDYQLKKKQNSEHIEVAKGYFETLWEEAKALGPETNSYWNTMLTSMAVITSLTMMTYGFKAIIGKTYAAGIGRIPPLLLEWHDQPGPEMPGIPEIPLLDDLPRPARIDDLVQGNPVAAILAPATMQILAAFGGGALARRSGNMLAAQIVTQVIQQTKLDQRLIELAGRSIDEIRAGVGDMVAQISETLVDGLTVRHENMYLSNERLLMLQNEDGSQAVGLLQNGQGQTVAVPSVRLPFENWRELQNDLGRRLNITPVQDRAYGDIPRSRSLPLTPDQIYTRAGQEQSSALNNPNPRVSPDLRRIVLTGGDTPIPSDFDTDSDTSDSFVESPTKVRARESKLRADLYTAKLLNLRNIMSSMYNSMMSLPLDKQEGYMNKILELDEQHQNMQSEGDGYLDVVREAWKMDHPGENKESEPDVQTPTKVEEPK